MSDKIHPYFYSFDGHPIRCVMKTRSDDCDIPHLTKRTANNSLVLKCKSFLTGGFTAEATTDRSKTISLGKYSVGRMMFDSISFSNLQFSTAPYSIIPIAEKEREWVEKQLTFTSEEFRMPFGICSANYRYKIKGKIKK